MIYKILLVGLFCNVAAIGLGMFDRGAEFVEYVNLLGCVGFGFFLALPTIYSRFSEAVANERERCARLCEDMGAMEALEGEEYGGAAMVRVADRMSKLCAAEIRTSRLLR